MGDRPLVPLDGSARSEAVLFALDLWAAAVDEVLLPQVRASPRWPRYARGHIQSAAFQERAAEWHALNYLTIVSVPLQRRGWRVRPLLRFGSRPSRSWRLPRPSRSVPSCWPARSPRGCGRSGAGAFCSD